MTQSTRALTRGGLLARNVAFNIAGAVLPALAALVAVPFLVRGLGDARFGILALAWTALGYFSLFDLGVGRAVTHALADGEGRAGVDAREPGAVIWTALGIIAPVGTIAGMVLFAASGALSDALGVPPALRAEAVLSFRILSVAVPFAAVAGALRGALEGKQLFGVVNALRVPQGLITFLGPLAALPITRSLVPAMAILTAGRIALCVAHLFAVRKLIPEFHHLRPAWHRAASRQLLIFGGWLQVTHIVSPLMATLDRFVVGAVLGVGVVTYYATPHEIVTKLWLFVFATGPVFFSALATTGLRDSSRSAMLYDRLLRVTLAVLFLPALGLVLLAPDILRVWLGAAFVLPSTTVMQVLTVAVFFNCAGQGAYNLIQALGRPDITGKFHLAELPFYGLVLAWLLPAYGILGAAYAWSIRTVVDSLLLLVTAPRLLPSARGATLRAVLWLTVLCMLLAAAIPVSGTAARVLVLLAALPVWSVVVWRRLLADDERRLATRAFSAAWQPEKA